MPELTPNLRYQVRARIDGQDVLVNGYSEYSVAKYCRRMLLRRSVFIEDAWVEDSHIGMNTLDYKEWWYRNHG